MVVGRNILIKRLASFLRKICVRSTWLLGLRKEASWRACREDHFLMWSRKVLPNSAYCRPREGTRALQITANMKSLPWQWPPQSESFARKSQRDASENLACQSRERVRSKPDLCVGTLSSLAIFQSPLRHLIAPRLASSFVHIMTPITTILPSKLTRTKLPLEHCGSQPHAAPTNFTAARAFFGVRGSTSHYLTAARRRR